jgi:hypothetical protein
MTQMTVVTQISGPFRRDENSTAPIVLIEIAQARPIETAAT